ncbi:DUF4124 domain-containing protein [Entomomonas asaccharolytica]|uniref:DUF4124 domain-containing protein n=1 Tax=Entomomonas asaccharolytica TaxID=2785331 RepID=A0A974RWJ6_9GAMM|nr:DUF4124 domain-containing protein [Entomomonas asaccharolytica]QQP85281.1 DUF4124 domain-containing protein [Entomomonas asaccharolytica]
MRKILFPLLLIVLPVAAQPVYSYKDSDGNTVYTNEQPPANINAEQVRLPKIQTVPSQNTSTDSQDPGFRINNSTPSITKVGISGIPDEEALRANDGTFTVSVMLDTTSRFLPSSYQYQLLLDGRPYGAAQASNSFTLTNIDRGTHTIQAQVVNNGAVVASSDPESFTIQRVSIKLPAKNRPNKPQPRAN